MWLFESLINPNVSYYSNVSELKSLFHCLAVCQCQSVLFAFLSVSVVLSSENNWEHCGNDRQVCIFMTESNVSVLEMFHSVDIIFSC